MMISVEHCISSQLACVFERIYLDLDPLLESLLTLSALTRKNGCEIKKLLFLSKAISLKLVYSVS